MADDAPALESPIDNLFADDAPVAEPIAEEAPVQKNLPLRNRFPKFRLQQNPLWKKRLRLFSLHRRAPLA